MKNIKVNILNEKLETVKSFDGFSDFGFAEDFARNEVKWRGVPVEVVWEDDANNQYSKKTFLKMGTSSAYMHLLNNSRNG